MASTMANMVSVLMDMPNRRSTANVPSKTTGTAMIGINDARKLCRKIRITTNTRTIASYSVF